MRGNLLIGINFFSSGIKAIFSPGLKRFILVPIIINLIIFIGIIYFAATRIWQLFADMTATFPLWAITLLGWILWLVFSIASILITATLFVFVTNFIASPFYGILAEKTELTLTQQTNSLPMNLRYITLLVPKVLFRELKKLVYFLPWLILGVIIFIFPLTTIISPVVWILIMAWILAIQYTDYIADNHGISFKTMLKILKQEPLTVLGFGIVISISIGIPILNLLAPPAAVVGGTKLLLYLQQKYSSTVFN